MPHTVAGHGVGPRVGMESPLLLGHKARRRRVKLIICRPNCNVARYAPASKLAVLQLLEQHVLHHLHYNNGHFEIATALVAILVAALVKHLASKGKLWAAVARTMCVSFDALASNSSLKRWFA